ncbi:MAG TPA: Mur ligase family protein [Actinomycetota bacterium]|nr:Mur ligase family protein [Actinomycetota bacterium]
MEFADALRDLEARASEFRPEPTLERIRALADLLDNPQLAYPTVHVTGTNGKTTTTRLVTALTCSLGLTTGTFTSPHVTSVTERLSVCGEPISEEEFAEHYEHLLPFLQEVDRRSERRVSYFEALTALAYLWFADRPVSLGVFEVGMGGTWDATNLVRGDVAVLCPVGLDHPELGDTVDKVAREKAGIIKEGRVAVVREQRPEALEVIRSRCREVGATLLLEGEDWVLESRLPAWGGQYLAVKAPHGTYADLFLPLFGEQLGRNAAAAIVAVEALLDRALDEQTVRGALEGVRSPGRVEVVARHPTVVLDGAHNPDAAEALAAALREAFRWDRLHLVIGMFADKDVESVARALGALADRAYASPNSSPRSAPPERVASALAAAGVGEVETFATVAQAVEAARGAAEEGDLILVTGSFYTVADARPLFVGA